MRFSQLYREDIEAPKPNLIKQATPYLVLRKLSECHLPVEGNLTFQQARDLVRKLKLQSYSTFVIAKEIEQ